MTQKKNTSKPRNNTTTLKIEKEFYDEISAMSERYGMGRKPFIENCVFKLPMANMTICCVIKIVQNQ